MPCTLYQVCRSGVDQLLVYVHVQVCVAGLQAGDSRQHKVTSATAIPPSKSPPAQSHPLGPTHQPSSTYDNILKTLALLEEAPPPLTKPTLDDSHSHLNRSGYYLSVDNVNKLDSSNDVRGGMADPALFSGTATTASGGLSESKLQSILSYLDEMDKADQDLLSEISKTRSRPKTEALPTPCTASVSLKSTAVSDKPKKAGVGNEGSKEKDK